MQYGIWSMVNGRMGVREAWLNVNGKVSTFDSEAEATAEAQRLNKAMNRPESRASFRYQALPYSR